MAFRAVRTACCSLHFVCGQNFDERRKGFGQWGFEIISNWEKPAQQMKKLNGRDANRDRLLISKLNVFSGYSFQYNPESDVND